MLSKKYINFKTYTCSVNYRCMDGHYLCRIERIEISPTRLECTRWAIIGYQSCSHTPIKLINNVNNRQRVDIAPRFIRLFSMFSHQSKV